MAIFKWGAFFRIAVISPLHYNFSLSVATLTCRLWYTRVSFPLAIYYVNLMICFIIKILAVECAASPSQGALCAQRCQTIVKLYISNARLVSKAWGPSVFFLLNLPKKKKNEKEKEWMTCNYFSQRRFVNGIIQFFIFYSLECLKTIVWQVNEDGSPILIVYCFLGT